MQSVLRTPIIHSLQQMRLTDLEDTSFARAELQIGLARMFRQFEFELFDTVRERDIDHTWAHISGEPNKKGRGLRFKVVKCL